jgi:hypothetical protein
VTSNERMKIWMRKHPGGHNAHVAVGLALKAGTLARPATCEGCGSSAKHLHAHHWSYRKRLDVTWLCIPCHRHLHKTHWMMGIADTGTWLAYDRYKCMWTVNLEGRKAKCVAERLTRTPNPT